MDRVDRGLWAPVGGRDDKEKATNGTNKTAFCAAQGSGCAPLCPQPGVLFDDPMSEEETEGQRG